MKTAMILFTLTCLVWAQALPDRARFQPGDNPAYASPDYDDSDWPWLRLPGTWESQGYPGLDGSAWLRLHFEQDPALLPAQPYVLLGKIDDGDETYLNGHKIGQEEYGNQRIYKAPRGYFKRHNVLAIRVRDDGGEGGLTGGILGIYSAGQWRKLLNYGPSPKVSFQQLVTSNGLVAAVYDPVTNSVTAWPHIYKMLDSQNEVRPWFHWRGGSKPLACRYRENTHVIEIDYPEGRMQIYAPFRGDKHRLCFVFKRRLKFKQPGPVQTSAQEATDEVAYMRGFYRNQPRHLERSQRNLFEQSIALLKMAQVAPEEGAPRAGQIVASLPPGNWNICWPRDATFAILALNRLGMFEEARQALDFFAGSQVGEFEKFLGHVYGISVCRYFGNGQEESDVNHQGPNVELDSFGLFLMAVSDYVERSGDRVWLERHRDWLDHRVADLIPFLRDSNGLIRAESGPWEEHLPGRQHAWTDIVSCVGLRRYARLSGREDALQVADQLEEAIRNELVDSNGMLKGYQEARPGDPDYYDGGTLEAFAQGLFPDLMDKHVRHFARVMQVSPHRGYARLSQPGWYTWSEWPFLAMRLAVAYRLQDHPERARPLMARITNYAALNHNLIPELYGREDDNYGGAIPMIGYGAGAYILALADGPP
ncbi:hypothetical protein JST97_17405 [bacterium]|nr:hypothetical protein [bacterium]